MGDVTTAPLESARFIIAAGNGVTDWNSFGELAKALGATVGASRVVCDRGFLPRDRQVGSSGTLVSSRVYIALGISGAVQHLDGIHDVEFVISVNSDPGAPIHSRAVLPIVADANAVVQHLLEASVTKEHGHG